VEIEVLAPGIEGGRALVRRRGRGETHHVAVGVAEVERCGGAGFLRERSAAPRVGVGGGRRAVHGLGEGLADPLVGEGGDV